MKAEHEERIEELEVELTALRAQVQQLQQEKAAVCRALEQIVHWDGFPPTYRMWEDGTPMSFGAAYGSNGERDFMRQVASDALAQLRRQQGGE